MKGIVKLTELRKEYDDVVAVDNVDLELPSGKFFTLLGPSGSGKTTILRLIAGLETPTGGKIYINDEDVTNQPPYKKNVATVFQNYALFPKMTVKENVGYGLKIRGINQDEIEERTTELLNLVDMPEVGDRMPSQLSGGQQQRVALARSLAIEPKVLLLDEPLGALDEKLRREMQIELKEIQETLDMTFVYVTHDQEEALTMSDQLAVINHGKILQIGDPEDVYENPQTEFIAEFFRGSNIFTGDLVSATDDQVELSFYDNRLLLAPPTHFSLDGNSDQKFFIRSSKINFGDTYTNTLQGEVSDTVYKGETVVYQVDVGGTEIQVTSLHDTYTVGDDVTIGWDQQDAVLLEQ